jgi:hypothetical protein
VAATSSSHGVAATGPDGAPVSCLREEGKPKPSSSLEAMKNSSAKASIMAYSVVSGLLRGEPIVDISYAAPHVHGIVIVALD